MIDEIPAEISFLITLSNNGWFNRVKSGFGVLFVYGSRRLP